MKDIHKNKKLTLGLVMLLLATLLGGCFQSAEGSSNGTGPAETASTSSAVSWEESHSNDADPNYDVVFNNDEVLEIYITIDADDWAAMNTDLADNLSSVNANQGGGNANKGAGNAGGRSRGGQPAADSVTDENNAAPQGRMAPTEGGEMAERPEPVAGEEMPERPEPVEGEAVVGRPDSGQDGEMPVLSEPAESTGEEEDYDPIWVESTISFEGDIWENVGIRFKGNSSLSSVAKSDTDKFSFKLDFDEFEDDYPEIQDQRFYGFKQLNLNNNYSDTSLLHEALASDLFRDFGLVSAETSFAGVYVDFGEGYQYFGLYTIVEEVDDTVLDTQFGDDEGNLYKPDGDAASFAAGSYDASEMEKKTNEDQGDYSDVEALYTIINSDLRTTDQAAWTQALEDVFDVDIFLKWLAVNTTIVNWDTYGTMTHNFYLYNNPETNLLTWIPWDNNEALAYGKRDSGLSLGLTEVSGDWPLISYIIEVPEYRDTYEGYLAAFVDQVFDETSVTDTINEFYELIQPYAYAEEEGYTFIQSDAAFDSGVDALIDHVAERIDDVENYLQETE